MIPDIVDGKLPDGLIGWDELSYSRYDLEIYPLELEETYPCDGCPLGESCDGIIENCPSTRAFLIEER